MHELRSLDLIGRYDWRRAPRDPITVGTAAVIGGSLVSGVGTLIGGSSKASAEEEMGRLAQQGAEFQAKQFEGAADESRMASERVALDTQRKGRLALSSLVARAAAGGDATTSGDVLKLTGDIAGRGEYEALADLYTGENRARGLLDEATAKRYEGAAKEYAGKVAAQGDRTGSYFGAAGTILKGVGVLAGKSNPYG